MNHISLTKVIFQVYEEKISWGEYMLILTVVISGWYDYGWF